MTVKECSLLCHRASGYIVARSGRYCINYYIESYDRICCLPVKLWINIAKWNYFFVLLRLVKRFLPVGASVRSFLACS